MFRMFLPTPSFQKTLNKNKQLRVLGVDPGYEKLGMAIIDRKGGLDTLVHSECFKTKKTLSFEKRLLALGERVEGIIEQFKPDILAIENLFVSNNQKTAMRVGEVRGVVIYACQKNNLSVLDFTPLQVKMAVTGYGKSDKKQVEKMVRLLVSIEKKTEEDDEIDAIAIALTGSASFRLPTRDL